MILPVFNLQVITNGNMANTLTSSAQGIANAIILSAQCNWVGSSPTGTFNLQCSNDNINFNTVASAAVSGNTGIASINFEPAGFYYAQVQYVPSGGTGTCQCWLGAKALG